MISRPTVGRQVHYYPYPNDGSAIDQPLAATVSVVHSEHGSSHDAVVSLHVARPQPNRPWEVLGFVSFSETPKPGHWSWPPRVP